MRLRELFGRQSAAAAPRRDENPRGKRSCKLPPGPTKWQTRVTSEQSVIATRIARMGSYKANPNNVERAVLGADFYSAALSAFSKAQDTYSGLLSQAQTTALAETPTLYQISTDVKGENLFDRRDFLFLALALALVGMCANVTALLWPTELQMSD